MSGTDGRLWPDSCHSHIGSRAEARRLKARDMSTAALMREMRWVRPRIVVQIPFVEWTEDA
jgi:hypothetical protein